MNGRRLRIYRRNADIGADPVHSEPPLHDTQTNGSPGWHATTILMVRKDGHVVIGGDGQVSLGPTVIKANARKVRRLGKGGVIAGFAGATADAFTLFERLEAKLEQYPGQLTPRLCGTREGLADWTAISAGWRP